MTNSMIEKNYLKWKYLQISYSQIRIKIPNNDLIPTDTQYIYSSLFNSQSFS